MCKLVMQWIGARRDPVDCNSAVATSCIHTHSHPHLLSNDRCACAALFPARQPIPFRVGAMPGNCFTVLCIDTDQRPQESTATNTPPPPSLRPETTIHGSDVLPRPSEVSSPTRPAVSEKDLGGIDGPRDQHADRIHHLLDKLYKQPAEPPVPVVPTPDEPHGADSPRDTLEPEGYDAPSSPTMPLPAPPVAPTVPSVSPAVGPSVPRAPRINVSAAWEEIGRLGAGSFGTVFKARCLKTGTIFAVKKVPFSKEEQLTGKVKACVMALEKEMRVLRQLW